MWVVLTSHKNIFRFIWDINAEKRAKMAAWKAERAAKAAGEIAE